MGTVFVSRCPLCNQLVGEGMLYEHQQRACSARLGAVPADVDSETFRRAVREAIRISTLSPCQSKRGAAIFAAGGYPLAPYGLFATGFNKRDGCDGSKRCKATCRAAAIHAEQLAILNAGRKCIGADLLHVKTIDGDLVVSGPPSCLECSKLALYAGIVGVWLFHLEGWRRYSIAEFHRLSEANAATRSSEEARR